MKAISRKILSTLLSLCVLLSLTPAALASQALGDDLDLRSTTISRGTELGEGTFWSNSYSDLRQENYIVYTPNSGVTPIVTYGDYVIAKTSVADMASSLEAQGYRVVAGINGDYYGMANGVPMGSVMTEGVLRAATANNYAAGFRADGSTILGAPKLSMRVTDDYGGFTIASVNQVRYSYSGIYLYTHDFNSRHSTGTNEAGYDVVCSAVSGRLSIGETLTLRVERVLPEAVDTVIGKDEYVLTANLSSGEDNLALLRALQEGDTLSLSVTAADSGWNDVEYMIGALYQLVENGEVCKGLEAGAAPRTAIGQRADGSIVLYTIDGRKSGYSIGASLTQVAQRLIELGCVTALSLDGGGSTAMSVTLPENESAAIYNTPSETPLRKVSNHIFLVATSEPSGRFDHVSLRTDESTVLAGAKVPLHATAVDTNYLPMDTALTYSSDRGSVYEDDQLGPVLVAPASGGSVSVTAKANGQRASVELTVVESPDSIKLLRDGKSVSSLTLSTSESVALSAQAIYHHLNLTAQNGCFTWSLDGEAGSVDANGTLTAANHAAYGTLTVRAGSASVSIPVTVGAKPQVLLDGFESAQGDLSLNSDKNFVRRGYGSARWDYSAENASAAMSYAIPSGYDRARLWVYGDGKGGQLSLTTDTGETAAALINFTGWTQLSFIFPSGSARITGAVLSGADSGTIYLDQLVAASGTDSDTTAPRISLSISDGALTGQVFDGMDGGAITTLRVTCDGKSVNYTHDRQTGALRATLPSADGAWHRVTVTAGDANGNLARQSVEIAPAGGTPSDSFPDMSGHWAEKSVSYLKRVGVTNGDDRGNFNPDSNVSRQEFATLLYRYLAPTQDFSSVQLPFADLASIDSWALEGVKAMYALGVTTGSSDLQGRLCFNPRASISRAEAVTMIGRLMERGYTLSALQCRDSADIPEWAMTHVQTLVSMGALSDGTDNTFAPSVPMTRAQIATVLYNLV